MNESVNARVAGCKLMTSARIIFFSLIHTVSHIINNLINSTVRSLQENLKPRPIVLTLLSLGQYGKASVGDFPVTISLSVIK